MKLYHKKMIAPIIITVIFILYCGIYFGVLIKSLDGLWKYLLGIVPLVLAVVMAAVCFERIKEIRSGEEDDLSKY
ncbi:MAG: hypothetical protein ACI4II_07240 [Acutalibacteraceae bacterium]